MGGGAEPGLCPILLFNLAIRSMLGRLGAGGPPPLKYEGFSRELPPPELNPPPPPVPENNAVELLLWEHKNISYF